MSFALGAMAIIGTGLQVFSQIQQGKQEAQIHEYNAALGRQQAANIVQKTEIEVDRQRRQARSFTGAQRAAYSAAGVVVDTGSALEVQIADAAELELDAQILAYNGKLDELNALAGADLSLVRAQQARSSAYITAGTTLLTSIPTLSKLMPAKKT